MKTMRTDNLMMKVQLIYFFGPDNTLILILLPRFCFLTNERKLIIAGLIVPGISATIANVHTFLLSYPVIRLSGAEIFIFKSAPISPGPLS